MMKSSLKNQQLLSVLFLTGVLSLSTTLSLGQNATAYQQKNSTLNITTKGELISDRGSNDNYKGDRGRGRGSDDNYNDDRGRRRGNDNKTTNSQLPPRVANAVLVNLSKQTRISVKQLKITQSSRQTWSDGCLGLAKPGENCTQAIVEGWRVVVSNGQQNWVYRTNYNGRVLRLETPIAANNVNNLPTNVANLVLREAAQRLKVSSSQVKIVKAERRNWSDGCLGLGRPQDSCAAVVTPGWLVTVEGKQQRLVYRTGDIGGAIAFDAAASSTINSSIKPVQMPTKQISGLEEGVVFRAISSGGFAGRTYETTLFNDGRVVRVLVNNRGNFQPQSYQISRQQVQQFQQLLQQQQFNQFDGLKYPVNQGAADFINITLISQTATTSYIDINQNRLPRPLQEVIKAWNQIASNTQ
ncbi:hypothetical protein [Synechocystis sp. PCC 7509]|uniref:hypothetical protein n=1 Tax=Synechocystis sp. PCC 7509 TaxID=927677 RepID=UPI0002ABA493|nr:hypothetical protein [Synechocystis sp. PCC 7509]